MAIEEQPEINHTSDHILDWLEDSVSFLPSFLDDPYGSGDIGCYQWWDQGQELDQDFTCNSTNSAHCNSAPIACTVTPPDPAPQLSDSSKKRKLPDDPTPGEAGDHQRKKNQCRREDGDGVEEAVAVKKSVGSKKGAGKSTGNNCNNGNSKEGRWAEQLLNPCAAAITSGNPSRVQHLLYVLHELASPTGDANHRLAYHGLRALSHHLSSSVSVGPVTFSSTEPRFFQRSLLKFYEVSPWFAIPNNIANTSILQILNVVTARLRNLHILDIGVSHGVQWPTLLEALSRRPGGPPPLVRLTVVAAATADNDQNTETPFSIPPLGDNFSARLLSFANSLNINLQINKLDNHPLQSLTPQLIPTYPDETLIVCAQFRLHHLNHNTPDDRTEFLNVLRKLEPEAVILSENNMDCCCTSCGDFATGFSRRIDYLWKYLDSISAAFKGRESEERRLMEGEAAKALTNPGEMNESKDKWCDRMRGVGFAGEVFGEETIDGARALLRKYDSNWEMRIEEKDGCVGLWWKGQPVSFCSLWRPEDTKPNDS